MADEAFTFDGLTLNKEQSYDMFAIRRVLCQLLTDRFYNLPPEDADEFTYESFLERWNNKFQKDLTLLASKVDDDDSKIMVFFPTNDLEAKTRKLSVDKVKSCMLLMKEQSVNRAILVVEKPLMGHAQQAIDIETEAKKNKGEEWRIETFLGGEMKVNITRHELVPKHTILTDDEKKQLLKRYNLQEKHLPRIQKSDPIARYYGLERRQVVRIERASETAGRYLTYRLVA